MIRKRIVVSRYAEAYLGHARSRHNLDQALSDLAGVKNIFLENPELSGFLSNPEIAFLEKCAFIDRTLKDGFSDDIRNFIKLLLDKGRFNCFLQIAEYVYLKYGHEGQVEVLLKTAYPLELDLISKIEAALRKKFAPLALRFYIDLDGSILGGVQVVIGNKIIDGSVQKGLAQLREKLSLAGNN